MFTLECWQDSVQSKVYIIYRLYYIILIFTPLHCNLQADKQQQQSSNRVGLSRWWVKIKVELSQSGGQTKPSHREKPVMIEWLMTRVCSEQQQPIRDSDLPASALLFILWEKSLCLTQCCAGQQKEHTHTHGAPAIDCRPIYWLCR